MKKNITRWMITAAAVTVALGSAAAQTFQAEVPLSFRVGNKLMAPGTYTINLPHVAGSTAIIRNELGQSAILMASPNGAVLPAWRKAGSALLGFECGEAGCVMRALWDGYDLFAYRFYGTRPTGEVRMAVVSMTPVKAD